ncbi:hypothetical protein BT93_H3317 [Corymbia citriodora subsp. variegata]|nr:hypothetical protein BT93_H3317 [Corymbia citriodora subsp. variegata]
MMDRPFFSSHWSSPSWPRPSYYSPPARVVPIRSPAAALAQSPPPKVVSIPVHFVGSERSRSDAALRIQSAFRGFLVRRSVRRIEAVRREVDEVERRISTPEAAELMRRDERERLKVSETLMSLFFRLDSVWGVDAGVRECRKAVIRRAIALQERVDAIVAGGSSKEADVEGGDVAKRESVEADDLSSGVVPPSGTTKAVVARLEGESEQKMVDAEHSADAGSESYQTEETPAEREAAPESDVAEMPEGEHSVEAEAVMEQPAAGEVDTEHASQRLRCTRTKMRSQRTITLFNRRTNAWKMPWPPERKAQPIPPPILRARSGELTRTPRRRRPPWRRRGSPTKTKRAKAARARRGETGRARSCWRGWWRTTRR